MKGIPAFDPSKPFEVDGGDSIPAFDPSQPFEVDSGESAKPEGRGFWGTVAYNLDRVPAAIRGGVQAYQTRDPYSAADMAWQGLKAPESVQTSPEMMARFGADTTNNIRQVRTPPPGTQFNFQTRDFTPAKSDTAYTNRAQDLGNAFPD